MKSPTDKQTASFQAPIELMRDCHRRIEKFLDSLLVAVETAPNDPLIGAQKNTVERGLRYFSSAAPLHTQDEEASLFPRLRKHRHPDVLAAMEVLSHLEVDHQRAATSHGEIDLLGRLWVKSGVLTPRQKDRLHSLISDLKSTYATHIDIEDNYVYPLADRVLDEDSIQAIGREMADRRGVDFQSVANGARCKRRRQTLIQTQT